MSSSDASLSNVLDALQAINPEWSLVNFPSRQAIRDTLSANSSNSASSSNKFNLNVDQKQVIKLLTLQDGDISPLKLVDLHHILKDERADVRIAFLLALNSDKFPYYENFLGETPTFGGVMMFLGITLSSETRADTLREQLRIISNTPKLKNPVGPAVNLSTTIAPFLNLILSDYNSPHFNKDFYHEQFRLADKSIQRLLDETQANSFYSGIMFDGGFSDLPSHFPKTSDTLRQAGSSVSTAASSAWTGAGSLLSSTSAFFSRFNCTPSQREKINLSLASERLLSTESESEHLHNL